MEELDGDLLALGPPPQIDDTLAALPEPAGQLEGAQPLRIPAASGCTTLPPANMQNSVTWGSTLPAWAEVWTIG
nr:hypothetical protein GCM10020093_036380 [Planobispora longispora]